MAAGNIFGYGFMILFGIVWTLMALSAPAPVGYVFPLFGVLFIAAGVYRLYKSIKDTVNAPKTQTQYQAQPQEIRDVPESVDQPSDNGMSAGYCPYCGAPLSPGFVFCGVCGRRLG